MPQLKKYKKNLLYGHPYIYSRNVKVAEVNGDCLYILGLFDIIANRHIEYAAKELKLKVIKWEQ